MRKVWTDSVCFKQAGSPSIVTLVITEIVEMKNTFINPVILKQLTKECPFGDQCCVERTYNQGKREWNFLSSVFFFLVCAGLFTQLPKAIERASVFLAAATFIFSLSLLFYFLYISAVLFKQEQRRIKEFNSFWRTVKRTEDVFGLQDTSSLHDDEIVGVIRKWFIEEVQKFLSREEFYTQNRLIMSETKENHPEVYQKRLLEYKLAIATYMKASGEHRRLLNTALDLSKQCLGDYRVDKGLGLSYFFKKAEAELAELVS